MELDSIEKEVFLSLIVGWIKNNKYMSSFVHVDNKGKDISIFGSGPTRGLREHSLTAEKMYSFNFTVTKNKLCLSLHYK